jgi:hypothetical protein
MINELDLVVLKRDVPSERLTAGDVGTVVLVHQEGEAFEVEFMTLSGDTVAVVTLTRPTCARSRRARSSMRAQSTEPTSRRVHPMTARQQYR